jgi:single-stranded-DNA-specific exonuclease
MKWIPIKSPTSNEVIALSEELSVDLVIAKILIQRGIKSFDSAKTFFRPSLNELHDPFLMKDMKKAVQRIEKAILGNKKIMIYGDYDVDGTTSVTLVYSFLKSIYNNVTKYIPDRYKEGYGVSRQGVDYAKNQEIDLIIALDCGITAIDKVKYAKELEIDFIICDHHIPLTNLPEAEAVLDPKRNDCEYPFKELCGCGIGFKLIHALNITLKKPFEDLLKYLDLVAVAIASDIVPINGENRILTFFGLEQIRKNPRPGFKLFLKSIKNVIDVRDLIYVIAPRINAAGRMDHGIKAVDLLLASDSNNLISLARNIELLNTERKVKQELITEEALLQIHELDETEKFTTVVYNSKWHKGVVGIVASKLIEHYFRPTIVLTKSEDEIVGSVRSVPGFDIYEVLQDCKSFLNQFGGHKYAAGLSLSFTNLEGFKLAFEKSVKRRILEDQRSPSFYYDTEIRFDLISPKFNRILSQFGPFGPQNRSPIFKTSNCRDSGFSKVIGRDKSHLSIEVKDSDGIIIKGIAFGMAKHINRIKSQDHFSILYSIEENNYKGIKNIQLKIKDINFEK